MRPDFEQEAYERASFILTAFDAEDVIATSGGGGGGGGGGEASDGDMDNAIGGFGGFDGPGAWGL